MAAPPWMLNRYEVEFYPNDDAVTTVTRVVRVVMSNGVSEQHSVVSEVLDPVTFDHANTPFAAAAAAVAAANA